MEILLRSLNEDNVYKITLSQHQPHTCLAQASAALPLWHKCLGHPSTPTILHALKTNNISFTGSLNKCIDSLPTRATNSPFPNLQLLVVIL